MPNVVQAFAPTTIKAIDFFNPGSFTWGSLKLDLSMPALK
jgi:hypothetical protein